MVHRFQMFGSQKFDAQRFELLVVIDQVVEMVD